MYNRGVFPDIEGDVFEKVKEYANNPDLKETVINKQKELIEHYMTSADLKPNDHQLAIALSTVNQKLTLKK